MKADYRNVSYDQDRRRPLSIKALFVITVSILLVTFFVLKVLNNNTLPIRSVQIGGAFHYVESTAIRKQIEPLIKGNFLTIDIKKIHQALEKNTWLEHVSIRRIWPDTLRVYVIERTPIARWSKNKLLSDKGVIFAGKANPKIPKLPLFIGPKDKRHLMVRQYKAINKFLSAHNLKVRRLVVNARRAWTLDLRNGVSIKLGRAELDLRIKRLKTVYSSVLASKIKVIKVIDLRYTNGFAVKWRNNNKPKKVAFGG